VSDFDERLAALDPAAGQPYQHRDLDALISRVTAQPRPATRRLWRNIELKIAGTLIAGSLVVAGTLAIVEGGAPALPALALQKASSGFAVALPAKSATMELYAEFDFSAGAALSTSAPSSLSYELTIPHDGAQVAAHVALVFGVVGSPVNTNGNGSDWTVKSSSGAALDYENSGVPQWYYSSTSPQIAPATASSTPVNPLPSKAVVANDVQHYLAKIGFNYAVASPSFGTSTTSTTDANGTHVTSSTEDVTYNVVIDGVTTDQSVNFSVEANNVVAYASGPAFDVGTSYGYPLESPSAGVAALNAAQKTKYSPSSAQATSSGPPIVDVTLNNNTLSLQTYELTNGTWWLLPVFNYQGAYIAHGTSSTGTWSEVAIAPSYVQLGNNSTSDDVTP
jgi:hypothetical protein